MNRKTMDRVGRATSAYTPTVERLAIAAALYGGLIWYFLRGQNDQPGLWLVAVNWFVGAMGCFVLSRRWIGALGGSLLAGAVYGIGPFAIGLAAYHPLAGVPSAMVGWLFCPAAFWRRWAPWLSRQSARLGRAGPLALTAVLCALPFAGMAAFFWVCRQPWMGRVFPLPLGLRLEQSSLIGLAAPLAMRPHEIVFGFYHVPVAALLMGLCMYFVSGRFGIMLIVGPAIVLGFAGPVADVSPVLWASIPLLFGAIVIGLGAEGLAWAGAGDGPWLLFCVAAAAVITAGCAYLGWTDGAIYRRTALLQAGGFLVTGVIYAMTRAGLRLHPFRWAMLSAAMGVDILGTGKQLAEMVF